MTVHIGKPSQPVNAVSIEFTTSLGDKLNTLFKGADSMFRPRKLFLSCRVCYYVYRLQLIIPLLMYK